MSLKSLNYKVESEEIKVGEKLWVVNIITI